MTTATKKDPVCKMDVDMKTAEATSKHRGETYYFCCSDCKEKFDKEPERYTGTKKGSTK
ncbi:MAG: YHS domain-containing protein [Thermoguttaceae bacterium]